MKIIKNVSVIGAGTMGSGIAHLFAQFGFQVKLIDTSKSALDKGITSISNNLGRMLDKGKITESIRDKTLARIHPTESLRDGVETTDLVVEAATENVEIKLKIFKQLDGLTPNHAILASNTSSIPITQIAAATQRPEQVIGMHFMNPVPLMKLVEVIRGYNTSHEVVATVMNCCETLGKYPVEVNDYPGFVSNRILMPMLNEAIETLYNRVAGVKEIDEVMKLGMAHPMGPLQLADFIGLDVCLSILEVMYQGFKNPKYAPCPLLVNMVRAGKLGIKSGEGFYNYRNNKKAEVISREFTKLN